MTIISWPCNPSVIRSRSGKPVPRPFNVPCAAEIIFDRENRLADQFLDRGRAALRARLVDAQNFLLHLVQQRLHVAFVIINAPDDVRAGGDHPPQQKFFLHDFEVVAQVRRARHRILKLRQIRDAADLFEHLLVLEPLLERDDINRLARVIHRRQRLVNCLVPQIVKNLLTVVLEFFDALAHALVRRKQHATEHALLALRRMWRQPVQFERVGWRNIFTPPRLLQIGGGTGDVGNGINHGRN